jgi:hypothetical protein
MSSSCAVVMGAEPVGALQRGDAPAQPEREAAAGEAVHGGGHRRGHQRVAGVVVGGGGGDLQPRGGCAGGPAERGRLLDVEAFGEEAGAEAQGFAAAHILEQWRRGGGATREPVEAELGQRIGVHGLNVAIGARPWWPSLRP